MLQFDLTCIFKEVVALKKRNSQRDPGIFLYSSSTISDTSLPLPWSENLDSISKGIPFPSKHNHTLYVPNDKIFQIMFVYCM